MENGKTSFKELVQSIESGDLDVNLKGGMILQAPFGTLLKLRKFMLKEGYGLIYWTASSAPLYLVHWNDLSEKKQRELLKGRNPDD